MKLLSQIIRSSRVRNGLTLVVIAALLLELTTAVQYYYFHRVLERELEHRAETELRMKAILIKGMLNKTEQLLRDYSYDIVDSIHNPDVVSDVLLFMVNANPDVLSAGMAFTPGRYPGRGRLYEPFAKVENGRSTLRQLAGPDHDYTKMPFYAKTLENGYPTWADPYLDVASYNGKDTLITTCSMPIVDHRGDTAGVFAIDISLEWLSDTLNARHAYPSSFDLLLTEGGELVCYPNALHINAEDVPQVHRLINDSTVERHMSGSGRSKVIDFRSENNGDKGYIYYANMKGKPHWQLAVVCYDKEVYGTLARMRHLLLLSMLTALVLLGLIIYRSARSERRLHLASLEQERIGSELRIARELQMTMLPPAERPAFPSRTDIDTCALLLPAREVGGDLLDYFIRDEKLYFCIGDVSGKGVPSALVMSVVHALFCSSTSHDSNPAYIMQDLNVTSCRNNDSNMFVTFFIGVLDLPTGRLRYCNAGHEIPILVGDEVSLLPVKANLPLGVIEDFHYEMQEIELKPGSTLFLYTDGLTEAMDKEHRQMGLERPMAVLRAFCGMEQTTPGMMVDAVRDAVKSFVGGAEQSDDLTLMAVRYTPSDHQLTLADTLMLTNELSQVPVLNDYVARITNQLQMEPSLAHQFKLAVEEAVVNVIDYAYPVGTTGQIQVDAMSDGSALKFVISDSGKAFDPTEGGRVDTTLTAEERPIGGLGIFLVRELMDSINYERVDGKNILTIKKKFKP